MPDHAILKAVHCGSAVISLAGFVLRFLLMLAGSHKLGSRIARVLPHVIDTVLLGSAILLAWTMGAVPLRDAWLTVKIAMLLVYIVLGSIALKRGRTRGMRALAGVAAILVFAFIASVARTKAPLGFFAPLLA